MKNIIVNFYRNFRKNRKKSFAVGLLVVLVLIFVSVVVFNLPNETEAAWWDEAFGYRHRVSFTHNAALSNQSVTFTLDTAELIAASLMQSDCDDTRFTTQGGEPLLFDLTGTCNNATTTYEVIFPSVINGSNVFYVYYGSPTVVNAEIDSTGYTTLTPSGGDPSLTNPTSSGNQEKSQGPVAYYKFDEGVDNTCKGGTNDVCNFGSAGSVIDGANSGIASPPTTISGWTSNGRVNSAMALDGSNDTVTVSDHATLDFTDALSVSAWVRTTGTNDSSGIVDKYSAGATGFKMGFSTGGGVRADFGNGSSSLAPTYTASNVEDGQWHNVTATYDGTTAKIYVDGVLGGTSPVGSGYATANSETLIIGDDNCCASREFRGEIDEVKIYNYALTANQVKSSANQNSIVLGKTTTTSTLNDGLVGYWKMDESSGNLTDSSGNGFTGVVSGSTTAVAGMTGPGRTFGGGSTDFASIADNAALRPSTFSVTLWLRKNSTPVDFDRIIGKEKHTATRQGWVMLFETGTNKEPYVQLVNTSAAEQYFFGTDLANSVWRHMVFTFDGSRGKLYENGVKVRDTAYTGTFQTSTNNFRFASAEDGSASAPITLDEVRFYNRAITETEIAQIYNYTPGPIGSWKFDEKTGQTAKDTSGSVYSATLGASGTADSDDPTWSTGKFGSGLSFDGNDFATLGTNRLGPMLGSFTTMAWVKTTSTSNMVILGEYQGGVCGDGYFGLNSGIPRFHDGGSSTHNGDVAINDGQWHHVAYTYNGTTGKMYTDGVANSATTGTPWRNGCAATDVRIGSVVGSLNFTGSIDELKVYNYALTAKKIVQDMNAGHPSVGSPVGSALGYWKFDEGADNTCKGGSNDVCNSGSSGTTLDGTSTATRSNSGKFNKALDFDGSDDVATIANSNDIDFDTGLNSGVTLSTWVNPDTAGEGSAGQVFAKSSTTYCQLGGTSPFNLTCSLDLSTDATVTVNSVLPASTWTHLALTWTDDSDDEITLWINGVPRGTSTNGVGPPSTDTSNLLIGGGTANNFDGKIDEFKVYSFELTADEIKLDYNRGSSIVLGTEDTGQNLSNGAGNPPIFHWAFDEKSGTSVFDLGGGGKTGTIGANSVWTRGNYGSAIRSNSYSSPTTTSPISTATTNVSMMAWVYATGSPSSTVGIPFYNGSSGANGYGVSLGNGSCGAGLQINVLLGGVHCNATSSSASLELNKWTHLAITVSGSNLWSLYINGSLASSGTRTAIAPGSSAFVAGSEFLGIIDETKFYNYARTPDQIAFDYNGGAPVGWWKFDECQGATAFDAAPNSNGGFNGNNGTITPGDSSGDNDTVGSCDSGVTTEMWNDGTTGKYNSSLGFDGTNDYVGITHSATFNMTAHTISAWVKLNSLPVDGEATIVSKNLGATATVPFYFVYTTRTIFGDGRNGFGIGRYNSGWSGVATGETATTGQWYHVVGTYDGTNYRIYVDGLLKQTRAVASIPTNSSDISIGYYNSTFPMPFNGQIDDVRIYNYALSAAQVKEIMNDGTVFFGPSEGTP